MKTYNTTVRDKNAELVIKVIQEATKFEDLYNLPNQIPDEISHLGHRGYECGRAFADKLTRLVKTDEEILIAIMTLRNNWTEGKDRHYDDCEFLPESSREVFWHLRGYFRIKLNLNIPRYQTKPKGYSDLCDWLSWVKLTQNQILDRYKCFLTPDKDAATSSVSDLIYRLEDYTTCKLVLRNTKSKHDGVVLIKKMCEKASTVDELWYAVNSALNRKGYRESMGAELKIALSKISSMI